MMQLRYDEDFIEAAVFFAAKAPRNRVPSLQLTRFHREREKLYSILDPDDRNTAFFRLHLEWFSEWGLEKPLLTALSEFPLLGKELSILGIRRTQARSEEGAELYVNEAGQRTGLLALRPERLTHDNALLSFLRHEFTHLNDMLDPAFGYSPELDLANANAPQRRLARERYRLLWDITIDGRLAAAGHPPVATRDQHLAAFTRGYAFWPAERQASTFDSLWRSRASRHSDLVALIADPRGAREAPLPGPGAACPLCGFSTFAWGDAGSMATKIRERIVAEFPRWSPEHGLCNRCLETYQAMTNAGLQFMSPPEEISHASC